MAEPTLNDLLRRLENVVRDGTIAEVSLNPPRCRVRSGDLLTDWLPWYAVRAGNVRTWSPPSAGEQCTVFSPGGDLAAGRVLVGLYSDGHAAPSTEGSTNLTLYPDGAVIGYDHQAHALTAMLPDGGTADLTAPASVTVRSADITLDAPQTTCTGQLTVEGLLTYQGGMAGSSGAGGGPAAVIDGSLQATEDVVANGISLTGHTHGGVQGGGGNTGAPQ